MQLSYSVDPSRSGGSRLDRLASKLQRKRPLFATWSLKLKDRGREKALSHSRGGRFWRDIARAVKVQDVSDSGATVLCDDLVDGKSPAAHKEFGGPIVARNRAALTIPIAPEAQGKLARQFSALTLLKPNASGDLVGVLGVMRGRGKNKSFKALFLLRRRTRPQAREPWWLTSDEALEIGQAVGSEWLDLEVLP